MTFSSYHLGQNELTELFEYSEPRSLSAVATAQPPCAQRTGRQQGGHHAQGWVTDLEVMVMAKWHKCSQALKHGIIKNICKDTLGSPCQAYVMTTSALWAHVSQPFVYATLEPKPEPLGL